MNQFGTVLLPKDKKSPIQETNGIRSNLGEGHPRSTIRIHGRTIARFCNGLLRHSLCGGDRRHGRGSRCRARTCRCTLRGQLTANNIRCVSCLAGQRLRMGADRGEAFPVVTLYGRLTPWPCPCSRPPVEDCNQDLPRPNLNKVSLRSKPVQTGRPSVRRKGIKQLPQPTVRKSM